VLKKPHKFVVLSDHALFQKSPFAWRLADEDRNRTGLVEQGVFDCF
jgi:hypothetical protein